MVSYNERIIAAVGSSIIIGGLISYGLWQLFALRKPQNYPINPEDIGPFKEYSNSLVACYIARERQWPPLKIGKISLQLKWSFMEIKRARDQCGLTSVYKNNQEIVGKIEHYNSRQAYINFPGGEIHVIPDVEHFTNFVKSITYTNSSNGKEIIKIQPYLDIGQMIDYNFELNNKNYVFKVGMNDLRLVGELYNDDKLQIIFAVVTAKQITAAIALSEPDSSVIMICFDIFNRRRS